MVEKSESTFIFTRVICPGWKTDDKMPSSDSEGLNHQVFV